MSEKHSHYQFWIFVAVTHLTVCSVLNHFFYWVWFGIDIFKILDIGTLTVSAANTILLSVIPLFIGWIGQFLISSHPENTSGDLVNSSKKTLGWIIIFITVILSSFIFYFSFQKKVHIILPIFTIMASLGAWYYAVERETLARTIPREYVRRVILLWLIAIPFFGIAFTTYRAIKTKNHRYNSVEIILRTTNTNNAPKIDSTLSNVLPTDTLNFIGQTSSYCFFMRPRSGDVLQVPVSEIVSLKHLDSVLSFEE